MLQCRIEDVQTKSDGSIVIRAHEADPNLCNVSSSEVQNYEISVTDPMTRHWIEMLIDSNGLYDVECSKIHVNEKKQQVRFLMQATANISATGFVYPGIIAAPIHDIRQEDSNSYQMTCGSFNIVLPKNILMFLASTFGSDTADALDGLTCFVDYANQNIAINRVTKASVKSNFAET